MGEFQVVGGSTIGEGLAETSWVPTGGEAEFTQPAEIGMNKPLFIRLHRIYTGPEEAGEMLVSSAVKADSTYAGAPRALHYLLQDIRPNQFPFGGAADNGSPIIYCTPANLDENLNLEFRLSFDDFDRQSYEKWIDLLAEAAGLPVFALSTVAGGLLGGVAGRAFVTAAAKGAKVIGRALDRHYDSDNDFVANYELPIKLPGRQPARSGWVLLRDDRHSGSSEVSYEDPANPEVLLTVSSEGEAFYVDTTDGHLHWRHNREIVNNLDQPYALLHVSSVTSEKLKDYQITRVSAALIEQFFSPDDGGVIGDVQDLLSIYNDVTMTHRIKSVDRKISKASGDEKAKLEEQRAALLEHVQDDKLRELLETE